MSKGKMFDAAEIQKRIKAAGSKPANFAFFIGSGPDGHVMAVDKTQSPDKLFKLARSQAKTGAKGVCGTVQAQGNGARFVCESPIAGLEKAIDQFFKKNGLTLRAEVVDAAAAAAEEAEEDEEDEGYPGAVDRQQARMFIKRGMRRPVPFAFGIGGPEPVLAFGRRGQPRRLMTAMRQAKAARKVCFGTMQVEDKVLVFTCENRMLPRLDRRIRRYLLDRRLNVKVRVQGEPPSEEDLRDDAEDSAAELDALRASVAALLPTLKELGQADAALLERIEAAHGAFTDAAGGGDVDAAEESFLTLRRIARLGAAATGGDADDEGDEPDFEAGGDETEEGDAEAAGAEASEDVAAEAAPGTGETEGDPAQAGEAGAEAEPEAEAGGEPAPAVAAKEQVRLRDAFERLLPRLRTAAEQVPTRAPDIALMTGAFESVLASGDLAGAREILFDLDGLARLPPDPAAEVAAAGRLTVEFQKAQLQWRDAVSGARSGLLAVRDAILDDEDVVDMQADLLPQLDRFETLVQSLDNRLDDAITAAMNARDPEEKEKLTDRVAALVREYRSLIEGEPLMAAIDENPFRPVTVRARLDAALGAIERALA